MQPTVNPDAPDMWQQTETLMVIAHLNAAAIARGLTITPHWSLIGGNLANGALRSEDDQAIREFDAWRDLLGGGGRLHSYGYTAHFEGGTVRKVWVASVNVLGAEVQITADVPADLDAAPVTAALQLLGPIGVAA